MEEGKEKKTQMGSFLVHGFAWLQNTFNVASKLISLPDFGSYKICMWYNGAAICRH